MLTFGLATTVALTYFTRSYIIRVFARENTAAAAAAPVAGQSADDAAAQRWQLTVETFNVWGRPVFTVAPHANFHPLFSRLFNNVRVDLPLSEGQKTNKHKDLFIHMDQATKSGHSANTDVGIDRSMDRRAHGLGWALVCLTAASWLTVSPHCSVL